jgi:hypothetical protein
MTTIGLGVEGAVVARGSDLLDDVKALGHAAGQAVVTQVELSAAGLITTAEQLSILAAMTLSNRSPVAICSRTTADAGRRKVCREPVDVGAIAPAVADDHVAHGRHDTPDRGPIDPPLASLGMSDRAMPPVAHS